jgi:hypothetical protein
VRKKRHALAGACAAYSASLRIFPGLMLAGWVVIAGARVVRRKRMAVEHVRVLAGAAAGAALLFSLSVSVVGVDAYSGFFRHLLVHKHTPLTNNMGLETVLSQSYEGRMEFARDPKAVDPFERWEAMRRDRLAAFRPFELALLAALGIAFIHVVRRVRSLVTAQALSLVFVVSMVELTCYYYSLFILAAVLSRHRRGVEQWVLCVAGMSQLLAVNRCISYFYDDRYVAQSILYVVFAVGLLLAHWPRARVRQIIARKPMFA